MTNIQAALLYGQLNSLSEILEKKEKVFDRYRNNLNGVVNFQKIEEDTKHSNWMVGVNFGKNVDKLSLNLYQQGIENRPMFPPMSSHKHLVEYKSDETNSNELYNNCLILPSHPNLNMKDIDFICNNIKKNI
jgi:dTDP-4-amino-4,6-dideoxygalactose transaminase